MMDLPVRWGGGGMVNINKWGGILLMGGGGIETPLWTMLKILSSKTKTDGYST